MAGPTSPKPTGDISKTPAAASPPSASQPDIKTHNARTPEPWPSPKSCGSFGLPVGRSTAIHHFRVLRQAGLIRQYYVGTSRMNELRRDEVEEAFPRTARRARDRGRPAVAAAMTERQGPTGRYFEDFTLGDVYYHPLGGRSPDRLVDQIR